MKTFRTFALALLLSCGAVSAQQMDMAPSNGLLNGPGICSAACLNTTLLGPIDTTNYPGISVQLLQLGTGVSVTFQGSNDPVCSAASNWVSVGGSYTTPGVTPGPVVTIGTGFVNTTLTFPKSTRCFRAQITAYTSGTVQGQGYLLSSLGAQFPGSQSISVNPYPVSPNGVAAVPITGNATGTTGAVVGTLAGVANKTTYICGFHVDAIGGTASIGPVTLAGIVGSSMVFQGSSTAAGGAGIPWQQFTPCLPASAANTAITITTTADATATAVDVNSWGFQQ